MDDEKQSEKESKEDKGDESKGDESKKSEGESKDDKGEKEKTEDGGKDEKGDDEPDFDGELTELQKQQDNRRSPLEKAQFSLRKVLEQVTELGGDPYKILGVEPPKEGKDKKEDGEKVTMSNEEMQAEIKRQVDEEIGKVRNEFGQAEIDSRVSKLVKSESEGKVVKFHLENTLRSSGNIDTDVENAYILANKARFKKTFEELVRKADSKDSTTKGEGAGEKDGEVQEPNVSTKEREYAKKRGLVWDPQANSGKGGFVSPRRKAFKERMENRNTSGRHVRRNANTE